MYCTTNHLVDIHMTYTHMYIHTHRIHMPTQHVYPVSPCRKFFFSSHVTRWQLYQLTCISHGWYMYIVYHHLRHMMLWSPCVLYYNIHTWKMLWRLDLLEYKYTYTYTQTTKKWLPCVCQHYTCTVCIITHDYCQAEYLLLVSTQASKHVFPMLEYTASYMHMLHHCKAN